MSEQIGGLDLTPGECGLSLLQLLWNFSGSLLFFIIWGGAVEQLLQPPLPNEGYRALM